MTRDPSVSIKTFKVVFFASPGRVLLKTWWADRVSKQEGVCATKSIFVHFRRSHQNIDSPYCC